VLAVQLAYRHKTGGKEVTVQSYRDGRPKHVHALRAHARAYAREAMGPAGRGSWLAV